MKYNDLRYLNNKPQRINWRVVTEAPGKTLSHYESYDLVFDKHDLKIRGLS